LIQFNNEDFVEFGAIKIKIIGGALYAVFTGERDKWKTCRRET